MKRNTLALTALLLVLPVVASASRDVRVDVQVNSPQHCGWNSSATWIDFRPDRGAFVALYAAYSDGSVALVFPSEGWRNHWVEPAPGYSVAVHVPPGLRLESVQAVASRRWFDPAECWVAAAPRHHRDQGPRYTVTTTSRHSLYAWNFSIAWGSSHRHPGVRIGGGESVKIVAAGRGAAHPRTDRWTSGGRSGSSRKVKIKASPGTKSSKSRRSHREPKRRSRS